jgi:glycosyltransferase 2 family protein
MRRPEPLATGRAVGPDNGRATDPERRDSVAAPDSGGPDGAAPAAAAASTLVTRWLGLLVRVMRAKTVRFGFLALVLVVLGLTLVDEGGTLWRELQKLSAPVVVLAFVAGLAGLVCSMMVWREILADLGSRLSIPEAWRIFYIGQLSKYIPGSIWPILAQSELGADRGIPRSRSALSAILCYPVMICSGGVVAAITLPFASAGNVAQYFWILCLIPVGVALLSPPVLNRLLRLVLRLSGQPALGQGVSYRGLARTMVWAIAVWLCNGVMVYLLLRQLAGDRQGTFLVSVGGYALSWTAGFVAVFAPAGAGVREAVMIAVLHTQATAAIALTVTLVSRAISVVADATTGAVAAALVGRRRLSQLRAARGTASPGPGPGPTSGSK